MNINQDNHITRIFPEIQVLAAYQTPAVRAEAGVSGTDLTPGFFGKAWGLYFGSIKTPASKAEAGVRSYELTGQPAQAHGCHTTFTGVSRWVVVLSPTCPYRLYPQHLTTPALLRAQA